MFASDLLNADVMPLRPTDTVEAVLDWMDELRLNQLPVVDAESYKGLVQSQQLMLQDGGTAIGALPLDCAEVVAGPDWHIAELMPLFHANNIDIVPVVGNDGAYQGAVTMREAFRFFSGALSSTQGGFVQLSMNYRNYSMAEIARLVESNNMRILNSFVEIDKEEPSNIVVCLQVNTDVLHRLGATFERFGYQVSYRHQHDENTQMSADRLDSLFKYLNL